MTVATPGTPAGPLPEDLLGQTGLLPERCTDSRAAELVERNGAAILTGRPGDPRDLVLAAADLLGVRLRTVFPVRHKTEEDAGPLPLHSDGANVVVDVHGRTVRLRDPDEDYLFQLCQAPAPSGGDSVLVDGYRLLERLRTGAPELHAFLTTADVDFFGPNVTARGVPPTPAVRRFVEHTRSGRLIVRASTGAAPAPQEPDAAAHGRMLRSYADVLTAAAAAAPRFRLEASEILVVDNYRVLHGRDAFRGRRSMCILTVLSSDAW